MSDLDRLTAPYSTILCDIWGVVHDGGRLLPGAAERLLQWKREGKTRHPRHQRPAPGESRSSAGLDGLGLPRAAYDAITSSGEAGIAALVDPPRAGRFPRHARTTAPTSIAHGVVIADATSTKWPAPGSTNGATIPNEYRGELRRVGGARRH